jgi:hypothetical protein
MGSYYNLWIRCNEEQKNKIDSILGSSDGVLSSYWILVIEETSSVFTQALNIFIDLISHSPIIIN